MEESPTIRRVWDIPCTDAFGRANSLTIVAERGQSPGISFHPGCTEYALIRSRDMRGIRTAIAEASEFLRSGS